jgi:hypothetical protein
MSDWDSISSPADDDWDSISESATPKPRTTGQEVGRQVGLAARVVPEVLGAIPMAAADFGVGARNLVTGSNYESPSSMFAQTLDRYFPKRETTLEKGVGVAGNVLLGSKVPAPTAGSQAPAAYRTADEVRRATTAASVKSAQEAGYVVPPVTTNPTATNKVLEGLAGKLTTAQSASVRNQDNTARLAARALGLNEEAPLTVGAIHAVRKEAGDAYNVVREAGEVMVDDEFRAALDAAEKVTKGANRSFGGLVKDDPLAERIAALRVDKFDAGDAVDAIGVLRDYADEAAAKGSRHAAGSYRKLATALENSLDRHLVKSGNPEAIKQFREARTLIAKAYSVLKGFNESTGQVNAAKLAAELAKGKPLSGELRQIAQTAQAFPKATRQFNESMPGISPLDFYAAGGTAAISGNPAALAFPFIRQGARNALLSPLGQRLAVPKEGGPVDPAVAAALARGGAYLGQ